MRTITAFSASLPMSRSSRPLIRILVCLLITTAIYYAFTVSTAYAATYYVDDANGNDAYVGTSSLPWKTIARAYSTDSGTPNVQSGDTVYIKNGTYLAFNLTNYSNTDWITYKAATGHLPVLPSISISNSTLGNVYLIFDEIKISNDSPTNGRGGIYLTKTSYIKLQNITITGAGTIDLMACGLSDYPAIYLKGTNTDVNITGCTITSSSSSKRFGWSCGVQAAEDVIAHANINITNCDITGIGTGIYLGTNGGTISGCNIHGMPRDGIIFYGCTNLTIENNKVHDMKIYKPTLVETTTATTWNADGNIMTNPSALWNTAGETKITAGSYMELVPVSGTNCYTKNGEGAIGADFGISAVSADGTQITLSKGIAYGGQPSDVNYYIMSTTHADLIQANSYLNQNNITIRKNQFYDIGNTPSAEELGHLNPMYVSSPITPGGFNFLIENNLFWSAYTNSTDETNGKLDLEGMDSCIFRNNILIGYLHVYNDTANGVSLLGNIISFINIESSADVVMNYNIINRGLIVLPSLAGAHDTVLNLGVSPTNWRNSAFTNIFTDFANGVFTHASSTSLGVRHGDPTNYPATDILGNFRDSPPDAGCYEYVNHAPVLGMIGDKTVDENSPLSFTVTATDAINNTITYSAQNLPSGATFVGQTFSWTPDYNQAGSYQVTFVASDGYAQDSNTITITVNTVNNVSRPLVLAPIGNKSVNESNTLSFSISATDANGNTITYSAQNLPSGATFVGQTFSWTPDYNQAGSYQVTFIASDGNAQDSNTITITVNTVNNVNQALVLSTIGDKSVHTNTLLSFDVNAINTDGNTITYSATGLPIGATFAGQSFRWTPDSNQAGTYHVTFIASDGLLQDSETITITVYNNTDTSAPTVSGLSPAADSIQVPLDKLVILHITDSGDGVDANSVTIKVNDNMVYTGDIADYNSPYGCCHRIGAKADYTFIYQPNAAFDYDQNVNVVVNAQDLAGNVMSPYSYSFVTATRSFGENKMVNSSSNNLSKGHPATVRDSAGNIWVAWHAGALSSSGMKRGIYVGKLPAGADTFGTSVREANNTSDRCNAALAIDAYDKLYLAWQDNQQKKWNIYMSTSVDGINWSTETIVTNSDSNAINPVIAVDHSMPPKAYIAWQDDRAGNQEIYIASSSDGFATETISKITSDSSDHVNPAIAVDSANTVYVVWADSRNGSSDIYGAASNNGPWANVPIVTKPWNQTNPAIATEATGTILHLLWVDDTAGNKDIYYAASNGFPESSLTGRNIVDDNSGADQLTPVIITTGSTGAGLRVFACWQDMRNIVKSGNTDLYFAEVNQGKETNIFVSNNATSSNQSAPVIGVDRYGYPYLVWVDDRNQNTDIYYAGSTFVHSNAMASQNVSPASDAIIGTDPANITGVDDVSVVVPAGAYPCELNITISKVENPPKLPVSLFTFPYEFGPGGADFNQPVTIIIPYSVSASNNPAFAYWYNTLADALSQQGITNVETIVVSPTLYAIRFKTTHFTQFIVGGSVSSSIQVTKCAIIAGSKNNSDKISISGKIDATADDFNNATVIEVAIDSNDMVNPCVLTFPINSKTLKKGKYSYSGTENGVKNSFKYNVKTHSFVSAANNVNLSGLDCPLTFDINVGDYIGTAEVDETIVNGQNKPIPIILLMGVKYTLRVDKCQVKPGKKKPNTDQLLVKGSFTVEDTAVDMANRVSEGLVVALGTQTFTIPTNELKAGKGKFTCSKAEVTEGGVAIASFDFNKCSFILTIRNTNITAGSGTVDFGVAFAGYSQIRQITLM